MRNRIYMIIGVVIITILLMRIEKRKETQEIDIDEIKAEMERDGKYCIIKDGMIACKNPTEYSPYYYPSWRYRYPYHKSSHLNGYVQHYRRLYGRRFGRE
jgi:hypothetical protein